MYTRIYLEGDTSFHLETLPKENTRLLRMALYAVQRNIRAAAPKKSGKLARSFYAHVISLEEGYVESDLPYAAIQNYGGDIYPRNRQYLRFWGKEGDWVYAKHVHIPGSGYFDEAVAASWPMVDVLLDEAGGRMATGMGFYGR